MCVCVCVYIIECVCVITFFWNNKTQDLSQYSYKVLVLKVYFGLFSYFALFVVVFLSYNISNYFLCHWCLLSLCQNTTMYHYDIWYDLLLFNVVFIISSVDFIHFSAFFLELFLLKCLRNAISSLRKTMFMEHKQCITFIHLKLLSKNSVKEKKCCITEMTKKLEIVFSRYQISKRSCKNHIEICKVFHLWSKYQSFNPQCPC